jgi:hypothetical protein
MENIAVTTTPNHHQGHYFCPTPSVVPQPPKSAYSIVRWLAFCLLALLGTVWFGSNIALAQTPQLLTTPSTNSSWDFAGIAAIVTSFSALIASIGSLITSVLALFKGNKTSGVATDAQQKAEDAEKIAKDAADPSTERLIELLTGSKPKAEQGVFEAALSNKILDKYASERILNLLLTALLASPEILAKYRNGLFPETHPTEPVPHISDEQLKQFAQALTNIEEQHYDQ